MVFRIITKPECPHCERAKIYLREHSLDWTETICSTPEQIAAFKAEGYATFPQVWNEDHHVGGADDLNRYLNPPDDNDF